MIQLFVKRGEEKKYQNKMPWVYFSDISNQSTLEVASAGELAELVNYKGEFIGLTYIEKSTKVSAFVISNSKGEISKIIEAHIVKAMKMRTLPFCRLFYAEGDGIPGLIIDRYGDTLSISYQSLGILALRADIESVLKNHFSKFVITIGNKKEFYGTVAASQIVIENGLQFTCNIVGGQKTGYYFDQRENHLKFAEYAQGKVLDSYCFLGGFGITAIAKGAAKEVTFIDSSFEAISMLKQNLQLNGITAAQRIIEGDVQKVLDELIAKGEKFELISIDPPPFAKSLKDKENALKAYYLLAKKMFKLLADEGVAFYSTCSHHITGGDIKGIIKAAADSKYLILEELGQPADHPIKPYFQRGKYLNTVVIKKV
jgi:23S rRNA (cytosine1962-C5)-methyltransferase